MEQSEDEAELSRACERFNISNPKKVLYTPFPSILQKGPMCGLVAIAMYSKFSPEQLEDLFSFAQSLNFTYNGEMFSAAYIEILLKVSTQKPVELFTGSLMDEKITEFLLNGGVMLVPYDADANFSPGLKNGHKAHWALISGVIEADTIYVIARQGKSKHLGIWTLESLAASNSQLNEMCPVRQNSSIPYKLPEDGIAGPNGIRDKAVLIYHK